MPQIFHPSMNTISRATIFGAVFILAFVIWLMSAIVRSPYATSAGVIKEQPVPFSHQHHVAECGIDCRYCHTSVEQLVVRRHSPDANVHELPQPACGRKAPLLAPVRASFRTANRWCGIACTTCRTSLISITAFT